MRVVPVLVAVVALATAATAGLLGRGETEVRLSEPLAVSETMLRIAVWPKGKDAGRARRWTLRCKPVGGSHPRAVGACRALAEHAEALAPLPRMTICTQIYGGPQVAEVTGTLEGKAVRATVTRADGCQIDRWNRLRPLFLIGS